MRLFEPGPQELCRCGHAAAAHEHFRPGTDCSLCLLGRCQQFSSAVAFPARVLSRLRAPRR